MKPLGCLLAIMAGLWTCGLLSEQPRAFAHEDKKGTIVELGDMKSRAPATWVEGAPENSMRLTQFKIPKVDGDARDAELVIFKGIGGSAKDNINRWKSQFQAPNGKNIDDISKVTEMKVGDATLTYLDIRGTYLFKKQPFNPNAKAEPLPRYRMLGVVFETKQNPYHIRLVGPEKTVEHNKPGFDDWLKAFK